MMRFQRLLLLGCIVLTSQAFADQELADPTMPDSYRASSDVVTTTQTEEGARIEWVLNSTLVSPYQEIAIINGKQLLVGEEINGAIVKKIDHQSVKLSYKNKIITLSLQKSFISQIKSQPSFTK